MNRNHLILFLLILTGIVVWAADSTLVLNEDTFANNRPPKSFTIMNPNANYDLDTQVMFWAKTDTTYVVSQIISEVDATGNEVLGDIKYCSNFQTLAGATVINDFDTTSGVRDDLTITSATIPANSYVYAEYDSQPDAAITQHHIKVKYDIP